MAAVAAQRAPEKKTAQHSGGNKQSRQSGQEKRSTKDALYALSPAAGAAIMALLLVLALLIGNFRALSIASPKDFMHRGDVQSIIEDRIDAAENILSVARRTGLDAGDISAAESAVKSMEKAKTAREISRADQAMTAAMAELTTAELGGEDARSMMRAADTFAEQGSFLRQEARGYNEKAKKAEKLYETLPAKFLLSRPDVYEGV